MTNSTLPVLAPSNLPSVDLAQTAERARDFARASRSAGTLRAYAQSMRDFTAWAKSAGLHAMPASPPTVGMFLAHLAQDHRPATLNVYLAAISVSHRLVGHPLDTRHPAIRDTMAGIRRTLGTAQQGKAALSLNDLRAMLDGLPNSTLGIRDRAILLVGFQSACRRSEIVALDVADLTFNEAGVTIAIRRSKTDQEGEGAKVGIPHGRREATCAVLALRAWLEGAGIAEGAVFRSIRKGGHITPERLSGKAIAMVVKRAAEAVDIAPARLAGHSLRAGFATEASKAGAQEHAIMKQTRHKSLTVARRYIRDGQVFRDNAAGLLDL